jgi:hypothetical protein
MKQIWILAAVLFFLSACSAGVPTPTAECESCDPIDPQGGAVYITSTDLLIAESYPVQVSLHISGDLPTPCHFFSYSYQIGSVNDRFRIDVSAWSESDPNAVCAQVLEPFDENLPISMEGAAEGTYTVYLNGELAGEFKYPA